MNVWLSSLLRQLDLAPLDNLMSSIIRDPRTLQPVSVEFSAPRDDTARARAAETKQKAISCYEVGQA
jgi:hypothetical protein